MNRYSIYDHSVLYAIGASLFTYLGFASVEVVSGNLSSIYISKVSLRDAHVQSIFWTNLGTSPSTSPEDCRMFYRHAKCFEADAWKETMIVHERKGQLF